MVAASMFARFMSAVARSTSSESTASKKSSTFPMAASCSRTSVPSKSVSSIVVSPTSVASAKRLHEVREVLAMPVPQLRVKATLERLRGDPVVQHEANTAAVARRLLDSLDQLPADPSPPQLGCDDQVRDVRLGSGEHRKRHPVHHDEPHDRVAGLRDENVAPWLRYG